MSAIRAVYDPLPEEAVKDAPPRAVMASPEVEDVPKPAKFLEFYTPSQLREFQEPEGHNLVGDYHIQRGAISVLAGAPGVGKSRAALALAIKGAEGKGDWFGLEVQSQFRTLILQNENGRVRLHRDFEEMNLAPDFDSLICVSTPPSLGMAMDNPHFREELRLAIKEFAPQLIIIDPWNSVARDAMEKDYQQAFIWLREIATSCSENPAILIIHHLRKPKGDDKAYGRSLVNLMSGSYIIFSIPRCAMILQPGSNDIEDNHVVFTPVKNNDGEMGKRTAYERRESLFVPAEDFDWSEFDSGSGPKKKGPAVTEEHVRAVFDGGAAWLSQKEAANKLQVLAGVGRSTAYDALNAMKGRFSELLNRREDGALGLAESVGGTD